MLAVDCSVAVKWLLEEPGDREALALLRSGERLVAPDLIGAEIGTFLDTRNGWRHRPAPRLPFAAEISLLA